MPSDETGTRLEKSRLARPGLAEKVKVKMALHKCILYLDENFAKLRNNEETVGVQKAIEEAVSALITNVGEQDARFLGKIEPSGSFYEGTKILQPDEFDFVVTLSRLSEFCDIVYQGRRRPHHILVRCCPCEEDDMWHSCVDFCQEMSNVEMVDPITGTYSILDGPFLYLDGSTLKQRFYCLLREAFKSVKWPENLKFVSSTGFAFDKMGLSGATQFAASEKIDFLWRGNLKVSVDLALAIEFKGWPSLPGPFDDLLVEGHPAYSLKMDMKSSGFHATPKVDVIWRISWSRAEKAILNYIFNRNEQAAISCRVAKMIKETHFVEVIEQSSSNFPMSICKSYTLKHLLMYLWLSNSSSSECLAKGCGEMLLDLLKLLVDGLKTGHCKQIFGNFSTVKTGPLLPFFASAVEKCIRTLSEMQNVEISQVPRRCEDFFKDKIHVALPRPPRKLSSYKITKIH